MIATFAIVIAQTNSSVRLRGSNSPGLQFWLISVYLYTFNDLAAEDV